MNLTAILSSIDENGDRAAHSCGKVALAGYEPMIFRFVVGLTTTKPQGLRTV